MVFQIGLFSPPKLRRTFSTGVFFGCSDMTDVLLQSSSEEVLPAVLYRFFFFHLLLSVSFLRTASQVWDGMNAPSFQLTVLLGPLPDVGGLSDPVMLVALLQNVLGFFPVPDTADFRFLPLLFPFLARVRLQDVSFSHSVCRAK